jgi:hypothetical protein
VDDDDARDDRRDDDALDDLETDLQRRLREAQERTADLIWKALDPREARTLRVCEKIIMQMRWHEFAVGHALHEIRLKRLYRGQFDSFREYIDHRWEFGPRRAYQLIDAWLVFKEIRLLRLPPDERPTEQQRCADGYCQSVLGLPSQITPWDGSEPAVHSDIPLPVNERAIRPLTRLKPPEQRQAWVQAVKLSGGLPPSSTTVEAAIREVRGLADEPERATRTNRPERLSIARDPAAAARALKTLYSAPEWAAFVAAVHALDTPK